jgi:hypothetical protein
VSRSLLKLACSCAFVIALALGCDSSDDDDSASGKDGGRRSPPAGERDASPAAPGRDAGGGSTAPDSGGGGSEDAGTKPPAASDGSASPTPIVPEPLPGCDPPPVGQLPELLSCTGLYRDIETKELADGLHAFKPGRELWSDGADKQRWIYLPEGTQIDTSADDQWRFPVGTRLFKEFAWQGTRVETRLFFKSTATVWLKAAYHWNADESEATRFPGGEVDVAGHTYYIPSSKECDQCHKGRADRSLGFEQLLLALPEAEGLTLAELVNAELLTANPEATRFELGDDGTGHGAAALGWLHVNCGVSCHNDYSAAEGYSSDLRLRLPSEALVGGSSAEFDAVRTTVGVVAHTPRWMGKTRIVAGSIENSLLYQVASTRDLANPKNQMPPIASRVVDADGLELLEDWILGLAATQ